MVIFLLTLLTKTGTTRWKNSWLKSSQRVFTFAHEKDHFSFTLAWITICIRNIGPKFSQILITSFETTAITLARAIENIFGTSVIFDSTFKNFIYYESIALSFKIMKTDFSWSSGKFAHFEPSDEGEFPRWTSNRDRSNDF